MKRSRRSSGRTPVRDRVTSSHSVAHLEHPLLLEVAHDLLGEERISFGARGEQCPEHRTGGSAENGERQGGHLTRVERPQLESLVRDLAQRGQLRGDGASEGDECEGDVREVAGELDQRLTRRVVEPVRIFEHEHEREAQRLRPHELLERDERVLMTPPGLELGVERTLPEETDERAQNGTQAVELGAERRVGGGGDQPVEPAVERVDVLRLGPERRLLEVSFQPVGEGVERLTKGLVGLRGEMLHTL